jgi:ubiquinone/menaquinone biosynthesis C-methylase UbiE
VSEHGDVVRREFERQAPTFEAKDSFFGGRGLTRWAGDNLPLTGDDVVLDVAGGAGHLSRGLADRARQFVVLDLTREMLEVGRRAAEEAGVRNVLFLQGDATALPFVDGSFDVVVSRFAVHHFPDPQPVLAEMARACRPGGHVSAIDMVVEPGPAGERMNELEIVRDPSHTRALTADELARLVEGTGTKIVTRDERENAFDALHWLDQALAPPDAAAEVERALRAELEGGEPTGLGPALEDGRLLARHTWVTLVAVRE